MTADREQRRRAIRDVSASIALEASAGTGKTSTLIQRILRLVLTAGPEGEPVPLARIAAITFTEKAAGELKVRLRQRLERIRVKSALFAQPGRGELVERALRDLEVASISTIHAFAVALLKARPLEAGLDPRFATLDEGESRLLFGRVWDAWLQRAIDERRGPLERALRDGWRLAELRELAAAMRANVRWVEELPLDGPGANADAGAAAGERLLFDVASWLRDDFLRAWREEKHAAGVVDFDDQLRLARDLLARSRAARSDIQKRFRVLLIDEFQDTDPIQLELALLLTSPDLDRSDPGELEPAAGRLFIVGDPKQSIYRFRGADIETYRRLSRGKLEPLELKRNFRSVPSILSFVDAVFADVMGAAPCDHQAPYLRFEECERTEGPDPPGVHVLPSSAADYERARTPELFSRLEAERIARVVAAMPGGDAWRVQERGAYRPARYGDVAVLLPVLTRVEALEQAFDAASIPYVLEGGKFYYARSEVSSALTVLGAIANPNDQVALYGALRSIFFGLSDEDLATERARGTALDFRIEPPEGSPLAAPFAVLRDLERRRSTELPSEIFERLLARTGAREVLGARPAGLQSLANLGKLARTLRAYQRGLTFSETIDLVAGIDDEGWNESESRILEAHSDAVRILTVHRAKGLEFPIVILAGLGLQRNQQLGTVLADPHERRVWGVRIGARDVESPRWRELVEREKQRQDAEQIRLLYVAMTRARDHLIVSTHARWKQDKRGKRKISLRQTRLEPVHAVLEDLSSGIVPRARRIDVAALERRAPPPAPRRPEPVVDAASLERDYAELERLRALPPGIEFRSPAAAHPVEDAPPHPGAEEARARGLRLGIALHEAMEAADFGAAACAPRLAREAAARFDLDPGAAAELEAMLAATLASPLVARASSAASAGRRVLRELPFVRPLGSNAVGSAVIEEGRIDLLFEEESGWVLVDYKTDRPPKAPLDAAAGVRERYGAQMLQYVRAAEALRLRIVAAYVLLSRSGAAVEMPLNHVAS